MVNLNVRKNPGVVNEILNYGYRLAFRVPYYTVDGAIEYVFNNIHTGIDGTSYICFVLVRVHVLHVFLDHRSSGRRPTTSKHMRIIKVYNVIEVTYAQNPQARLLRRGVWRPLRGESIHPEARNK